jgi:chemotaxis protein histidine kinase CheA
MAKQIKNSDLVQPKLWQETVDETNALIKVLGELEKSFKKVSETAGKTAKEANPGSAKGIKDINAATELLKKTSIETDKVRAQIATAEAQRTRAAVAASKQRATEEKKALIDRDKVAKTLLKQRETREKQAAKTAIDRLKEREKVQKDVEKRLIQIQKDKAAQEKQLAAEKKRINQDQERADKRTIAELNKSIKARERKVIAQKKEEAATIKLAARTKEQNRAYNKASAELNTLRKRFKDLAISGKGTKTEMAALLFQITKLDTKIKSVDRSVGQSQRNVGNYKSAFKGLGQGIGSVIGPMVGITAAIGAVTAGIRAATGLFREFGLVSAKVQAVSGATAEEFEALQTQAKELGRVTPFTASNVAQLQLELSKLGFTAKEIGEASESILQFAIATDSELGRSAEVVASTLNAFNLEASEAGRVADVAAKAFSGSALDIEKFATAIGSVGPAANAVDVSLERTTAILGKIVDSGIDASTAGTQLRNVFIELESRGLTWNEAIGQINGSQNRLSAANELFGKRGAVVSTVIANNAKEIDAFDESLQKAEGSSKAMADIIGDTLDGDIKKLQSAIQGATLENEGFETVLRRVIQFLTKAVPPVFNFFVNLFNVVVELFRPIAIIFELIADGITGVTKALGLSNKEVDESTKLIKKLNDPLEKTLLILRLITKAFKLFGESVREAAKKPIDTLVRALFPAIKSGDKLKTQLDETGEAAGRFGRSLQLTATEKLERYNKVVESAAKLTGILKGIFNNAANFAKGIFKGLGLDTLAQSTLDFLDKLKTTFEIETIIQSIKKQDLTVRELNASIAKLNDELLDTNTPEDAKKIQDIIQLLEDQKDAILNVAKAEAKRTQAQKDALKAHNKEIKELEEHFKNKKDREEKAQKKQKKDLDAHNKGLEKTQKYFDDKQAAKEKEIQESTVAAIDVIDQAFSKASDNRINAIDREIQSLQRREDALRQAAQNGSELAKDNLATNQRLQAEQELIREEQVKKAQRREIVLAGFKAYAENAGEPGAANKTLQDAIKLYTGLNAIIPQFYEGTEDTGQAGQALDSNGGRLAVLHDNERVMTKKQNSMMGGVSNDEAAHIVHDHINMTHFDHAPMVQVQRFESNAEVLQKFDVLAEKLDNLPNRMPRILDEKFDEK